jgi:hypothetical protein
MTTKSLWTEEQKKMFFEDLKKRGVLKEDGIYLKGIKDEVRVTSKEHIKKELTKEDVDGIKIVLGKTYEEIIKVIKRYCDLREEYYPIVACWIIGTYLHKSFNTFPYLFINAMRGSGKTRLLKLIASLSANGQIIGSPTEAVLFRIPQEHTLCIDEFEGILRKGNEGVRELLNASYKRGMKVYRMKKKQTPEGSEQVVEEFEPYRPICLANIWGMEEVLGDRCITMILEKSSRKDIMRIIEDFDTNPEILAIKASISSILVYMCSYFSVQGYIKEWNNYINSKYCTLNTLTTQTTQIYTNYTTEKLEMFNKIDETGINGRDLELFFPLLLIGEFIGEEVFDKIISHSTNLTKEKKEEEMVESKDIALMEWVSKQEGLDTFKTIKTLTNNFRLFLGDVEDKEDMWINPRWVGRALKRLNLVKEKRRLAGGNQVILNTQKAKEKILFMKGEEVSSEQD